ncbi:hypothetical protein ScPMuIL_014119 [Solemya velum]
MQMKEGEEGRDFDLAGSQRMVGLLNYNPWRHNFGVDRRNREMNSCPKSAVWLVLLCVFLLLLTSLCVCAIENENKDSTQDDSGLKNVEEQTASQVEPPGMQDRFSNSNQNKEPTIGSSESESPNEHLSSQAEEREKLIIEDAQQSSQVENSESRERFSNKHATDGQKQETEQLDIHILNDEIAQFHEKQKYFQDQQDQSDDSHRQPKNEDGSNEHNKEINLHQEVHSMESYSHESHEKVADELTEQLETNEPVMKEFEFGDSGSELHIHERLPVSEHVHDDESEPHSEPLIDQHIHDDTGELNIEAEKHEHSAHVPGNPPEQPVPDEEVQTTQIVSEEQEMMFVDHSVTVDEQGEPQMKNS